MKSIVPILLLLVLSLVLGGVLMQQRNSAQAKHQDDAEQITVLSNKVDTVTGQLGEQKAVNTSLEVKLEQETKQKNQYYGQLLDVSKTLETVRAKAQSDTQALASTVKAKDAEIGRLTKQNDDLTIQMAALNVSISNLGSQIGAAEDKLMASEEDREFLLNELKRLQEEKNDLERRFNNLRVLRDQVRKLKDEMSIAKRLEWVRRGVFGQREMKGGEILKRGFERTQKPPEFDLNVELRPGEAPVIESGNQP
jgi:chromosome segregation ATPase